MREQNIRPSTFNTEPLTERVAALFTARFGDGARASSAPPVMGGEDFSRY